MTHPIPTSTAVSRILRIPAPRSPGVGEVEALQECRQLGAGDGPAVGPQPGRPEATALELLVQQREPAAGPDQCFLAAAAAIREKEERAVEQLLEKHEFADRGEAVDRPAEVHHLARPGSGSERGTTQGV